MTMRWMDGFDHYGTGDAARAVMLSGAWVQLGPGRAGGSDLAPSTVQARTGTHALRFFGGSTGVTGHMIARRLWGASRGAAGLGFGLYFPALPTVDNVNGVTYRSLANNAVLSFAFQSDGAIEVFSGDVPTTPLGRTGQVIGAQSWNHVEFFVTHSLTVGTVEIRVNAVTVLSLTGVNTGPESSSCGFGQLRSNSNQTQYEHYIDDVFHRDGAGAFNNGFIGQVRILLNLLNGDTAEADWTVTGSATGWGAVDDIPPDGDTSYIEARVPGSISEFTTSPLDADVIVLRAVYVPTMMRQTEAGLTNVRVSLVSGGAVAAGVDRPITATYTYWGDMFESDPATGAPWTREGYMASLRRFEKTA